MGYKDSMEQSDSGIYEFGAGKITFVSTRKFSYGGYVLETQHDDIVAIESIHAQKG